MFACEGGAGRGVARWASARRWQHRQWPGGRRRRRWRGGGVCGAVASKRGRRRATERTWQLKDAPAGWPSAFCGCRCGDSDDGCAAGAPHACPAGRPSALSPGRAATPWPSAAGKRRGPRVTHRDIHGVGPCV